MILITTKLKLKQISPVPPAKDDVIDLSSAQDIDGDKIFHHTVKINADSGYNTGLALINISQERNQRMISGYAGDMETIIGSVYWNKNFDTNNDRVGLRAYKHNSTGYADIYVSTNPDGTPITYAPTPATTDNSTQIATTAFVRNYLGNTLQNTGHKFSNLTIGVAPSGANERFLPTIYDKNNVVMGRMSFIYGTDKSSRTTIQAFNTTSTSGGYLAEIAIGCNASGSVFTKAPTPATTDNSNQISTTAFVKSAMSTWNAVTVTSVTTYCASGLGGYMSVYQNPYLKLCCVSLNIQLLATTIPGSTAIINGFPKALKNSGLNCIDSSSNGIRMFINTNGELCLDGSKTFSAATWVNGSVTYPYSSL